MLVCPCIPIFFGKPEVDDIHKVSLFAQTPAIKSESVKQLEKWKCETVYKSENEI